MAHTRDSLNWTSVSLYSKQRLIMRIVGDSESEGPRGSHTGSEGREPAEVINGFSSGALVVSIGSIVMSFLWYPGALILSALSIVLGAVGLTRQDGRGMAAAGLAIGVLMTAFLVLAPLLFVKLYSVAI